MFEYFLIATMFVTGLCVGSFLNVCIYRIPAGESVVHPPSKCPRCSRQIRFYDNIPVLSYIFLRGKCRHCDSRIPMRYPLVELLTGLSAVAVFYKFGLSIEGAIYFLFIAVLIVITFIDIDHQIIPDSITLPGIPVGVAACFALPSMTVIQSVIGVLAGGGSLYLVAQAYYLIKKEEGMGGGDIKLLAMIGALTGWQGVLFTVFVGSMLGSCVGFVMMAAMRLLDMKLRIPFGPFLAAGVVIYIFFGSELIQWYFSFSASVNG